MLRQPDLPTSNSLIFKAFVASSALWLGAAAGGCSEGESGLVLGGLPPPSAPAGGSSASQGGQGGAEPSAGAPTVPGTAGEGGAGAPWVNERCTPTVTFENRDTTSKGQLFTGAVPQPAALVWEAAHDACRLLYRSANEVPLVSDLTLVVEDYAGIASTSGATLRLSTSYIQQQHDAGIDIQREIAGILRFTTSLVYQHDGSGSVPGWLMTGIADYVRLESGYLDRGVRSKGGRYDDNSQTTAFFLQYLTLRRPSLVQELNLRLAPGEPAYADGLFGALLGSELPALWDEYQATL